MPLLLKEKILEDKCSSCGLTEWLGNPLSLHLDHIDGNNHNHVKSNLRLLCPNCHSQTDTWCGKEYGVLAERLNAAGCKSVGIVL